MPRTMYRGKRQVMFNFLPGRTFEFEKVAVIARVLSVRGVERTDLNAAVVLRKIADEAGAWQEVHRPVLRDEVLRQPSLFALVDPKAVQSAMFPKVLWCQDRRCGRVYDFARRDDIPTTCPACGRGRLLQLRFVKIHRCGALQPLVPPACPQCHTSSHVALDTRDSERIANFRWVCRGCGGAQALFGGYCPECMWPDPNARRMDIGLHRAGRAYYAHSTVLLNVPRRDMDVFFSMREWQAVAAARYLCMPEVANRPMLSFSNRPGDADRLGPGGLSGEDLDGLLTRQSNGELSPEQLVAEMRVLRDRRERESEVATPSGIARSLEERTGVPWPTWRQAGQEMLEAVLPMETGHPMELLREQPDSPAARTARRMGFSSVALVSDYPIITASYGFSRAEYQPNQCRLNPFPADPEHGGKFPIFVDQVQADALLVSLNPERVVAWLERNGLSPVLPSGTDPHLARQAHFVRLLVGTPLRETLSASQAEARFVFGLLHTLSHLSIRQAALLCGLESTSLSEYLLPCALTFAVFSNHRFGATIGALTALYEQSLDEWLAAILDTRRCVYDPMCRDHSGNCHACTHLAETSCRFFNLNLSRAFLFGGHDEHLGEIRVGFFDPSLP